MNEVECQGCDADDCEQCCQHDDIDHGICENCGADRTDYLVSLAEHFSDLASDR